VLHQVLPHRLANAVQQGQPFDWQQNASAARSKAKRGESL
jgi:hypothetical protein